LIFFGGQNRHFIAVHLTGYGYEKKLLGQGEGKNKVEAGNWAAIEAMYGESKAIVDECEQKLIVMKEHKKQEKEAREMAAASGK
jgi:ribonuclease-3